MTSRSTIDGDGPDCVKLIKSLENQWKSENKHIKSCIFHIIIAVWVANISSWSGLPKQSVQMKHTQNSSALWAANLPIAGNTTTNDKINNYQTNAQIVPTRFMAVSDQIADCRNLVQKQLSLNFPRRGHFALEGFR